MDYRHKMRHYNPGKLRKDLAGIPAYAWVAILLHIVEGFVSYPLEINMMSWFHQRFAMNDITAGQYVSLNGIYVVGFALVGGWMVDRIGVRKALLLGFLSAAMCRFIIAFADSKDVIIITLNFGVSIGSALIGLGLHISVDKMDEGGSKNIAFSLLYCANNFGDSIAAFTNKKMIATGGVNEFQWVFIVTGIVSFVGCVLTIFCYWDPPDVILMNPQGDLSETMWQGFKTTIFDRTLHKAILMAFMMIGVRTMFRHLNNIIPLYMQRLYGADVDYGVTVGINPTGIIILAPLFGILFRDFKHEVSQIFLGTLISALSPLVMVIWRPANNQWPVRIFNGIFTIGEALYSPKVSQLAISIPPPGKKGIYSSLMTLPSIVGTIISGEEAGLLLNFYCPAPVKVGYDYWANQSCANLWIIVMAIAATTPIGILFSGNYLASHLHKPVEPLVIEEDIELEPIAQHEELLLSDKE